MQSKQTEDQKQTFIYKFPKVCSLMQMFLDYIKLGHKKAKMIPWKNNNNNPDLFWF